MSDTIYAAIPKVMGDIGAIAKNRKNPQQGYAFRGIDDMYNAVQPAMVKHGVFCAPEVVERIREERPARSGGVLFYTTLTVRHRFYASDGSHVDVVTVGEAMDSGDKSTNKAMSAAMKYALIELFAIPTEEDKDTENHTHEPAVKPLPPVDSVDQRPQQEILAAFVSDIAAAQTIAALNEVGQRISAVELGEDGRAKLVKLYKGKANALKAGNGKDASAEVAK